MLTLASVASDGFTQRTGVKMRVPGYREQIQTPDLSDIPHFKLGRFGYAALSMDVCWVLAWFLFLLSNT